MKIFANHPTLASANLYVFPRPFLFVQQKYFQRSLVENDPPCPHPGACNVTLSIVSCIELNQKGTLRKDTFECQATSALAHILGAEGADRDRENGDQETGVESLERGEGQDHGIGIIRRVLVATHRNRMQ